MPSEVRGRKYARCKHRKIMECNVPECMLRRKIISGLGGCICEKDNCRNPHYYFNLTVLRVRLEKE